MALEVQVRQLAHGGAAIQGQLLVLKMCLGKGSIQEPACRPGGEMAVESYLCSFPYPLQKLGPPEMFQDNILFILKSSLRSLLHTLFHLTARGWILMMRLRLVLLNFVTMAEITWMCGAASSSCSQVISTDGRKQAAKISCKKELRVWNIDDAYLLKLQSRHTYLCAFFIVIIGFVSVF